MTPLLLLLSPLLAQPAPAEAKPAFVLGDCLVLPPTGRSGRWPIFQDPIEADRVAGTGKAPRAGDVVRTPRGQRTWEAARANDAGELRHRFLRGGYVSWTVPSEGPRVLMLEARGHTMTYVNGEPRGGDPYRNGLLVVPVQVQKGDNAFLFPVGRGALSARLTEPPAPAFLAEPDLTLPDAVVDRPAPVWAGVVVVNAGEKPLTHLSLLAAGPEGKAVRTPLSPLPPLSVRKVGFRLPHLDARGETVPVVLRLEQEKEGKEAVLHRREVSLRVRTPGQSFKNTFVSDIDGSVQYYAVQPARPGKEAGKAPALVLTLHGAGVEAIGQANAYAGKDWAHIVAPTNRRPFGFDWEDWGRLDALEVLADARARLATDPRRTYVTGHSMGGHGTWHVGLTFPDRFAAIAPSAGWVSFWTYGSRQPEMPDPVEKMFLRAVSASDTLALLPNSASRGVYVLHGDRDDNVPVSQARLMRQELGRFHPSFAYHEQPGAGHWWGSACVDWPPLFAFLKARELPLPKDVRHVAFTTASPGVSPSCHWAAIEAQVHPFRPSTIDLRCDPAGQRFHGTTKNVARLALDLTPLTPGKPLTVELDGQKLEGIPWPDVGPARVWLVPREGKWQRGDRPSPMLKGPHRYGPFKEAFRNRFRLVYGTRGTPAENAWAFARARYDAESFQYRGNGSVEVLPDTDCDPGAERDRNVILYGHADSNAAWKALLGDSPVQVSRGALQLGEYTEKGEHLGALFVRPRPGSDTALVGVVAGTGLVGMRITDRLPYFVSGTGYPDCLVLTPEVFTEGSAGVRAAGFFGTDWCVDTGEFAWNKKGDTP